MVTHKFNGQSYFGYIMYHYHFLTNCYCFFHFLITITWIIRLKVTFVINQPYHEFVISFFTKFQNDLNLCWILFFKQKLVIQVKMPSLVSPKVTDLTSSKLYHPLKAHLLRSSVMSGLSLHACISAIVFIVWCFELKRGIWFGRVGWMKIFFDRL